MDEGSTSRIGFFNTTRHETERALQQFWRYWSRDGGTRYGNIIKEYRFEGSEIKERLAQVDIRN